MRRSEATETVYGVRRNEKLGAWAWKENNDGVAINLPRCVASGAHFLPYSCAPGHVTSWVLWFDLLVDVTADLGQASRLAGLMEEQFGGYLRERGEVRLTAKQVCAWIALMTWGDEALIDV